MAKGTVLVNCNSLPQGSTVFFNKLPAEPLLPVPSRVGASGNMAELVCTFPGEKNKNGEPYSDGVSSVVSFVGKHHRLSCKLQRRNELLSTRMRTSEAGIPLDSKVL